MCVSEHMLSIAVCVRAALFTLRQHHSQEHEFVNCLSPYITEFRGCTRGFNLDTYTDKHITHERILAGPCDSPQARGVLLAHSTRLALAESRSYRRKSGAANRARSSICLRNKQPSVMPARRAAQFAARNFRIRSRRSALMSSGIVARPAIADTVRQSECARMAHVLQVLSGICDASVF